MTKFEEVNKFLKEHWQMILGGIYLTGFLVWNRFLSQFGLFEYNFLQTKFISAGLWAILILALFYWCIRFLYRKLVYRIVLIQGLLLFVYIFFIFPFFIFPLIPTSFGGGMPIATSLIGTPDQIKYLSDNLQIEAEPNSGTSTSVQTKTLCLFFERDDRVVIGSISGGRLRVVTLPSREFIGYSVSPGGYEGASVCLANYFWPQGLYYYYAKIYGKL